MELSLNLLFTSRQISGESTYHIHVTVPKEEVAMEAMAKTKADTAAVTEVVVAEARLVTHARWIKTMDRSKMTSGICILGLILPSLLRLHVHTASLLPDSNSRIL